MIPRLLRGHLLLFDSRPPEPYAPSSGARVLGAAILIEAIRLAAIARLLPYVPLWVLVPALLVVAWLLVRRVAGLRARQIGFRPWREWTSVETSYFLQVVLLANVIFLLLVGARLRARFDAEPAGILSAVVAAYLAYGFYQELVYRGLLQREVVRRRGPVAGILAANVLYTFGPLHWNYYSLPAAEAVPWLASIFGIGLFFGVVFHRSGNLWLPAVFHAIGNAYMVTALGS